MKNPTTAEIVLEAIHELHAKELGVTRQALLEKTGLKLTVIDDRLALLVDNGQVLRIQRGVFVPAPPHRPTRIFSKTFLPNGLTVITIGDDHVLSLTRREHDILGALTAQKAPLFIDWDSDLDDQY